MSDNTWTVVQFLDDATVEAVPSAWIQGNYCHWPSFPPDKLINAIRKSEPLNTCWPSHCIKIFRKATFDDYFTARNKAKIAEDTSELETEPENIKRKIVQKLLSSSEDSIDDSCLPSPPKIKRPLKRKYDQEKENNKLQSLPQSSHQNQTGIMEPPDLPLSDAVGVRSLSNANSLNFNNNISDQDTTECKNCLEKDKHFKTLIQQGHILRGLITETLAEVKEIRQELVAKKQTLVNQSFFVSVSVEFPISSDGDMTLFEDYLEDPADFSNAVLELVKIGGSKPYDFVSRVAKLIISNEQALKYSWLGRKGKKKFSDMRVANLLIEALKATNLAKTKKEAETAIQLWLRRAFDRNNYKLNKKL